MRSKILFLVLAVAGLNFLTACEQDTDTPKALKRETYYDAKLKAQDSEVVECDEGRITLPRSESGETLGVYILKIHAANRSGALATLNVETLQQVYRSCLRPAILNRVVPARR